MLAQRRFTTFRSLIILLFILASPIAAPLKIYGQAPQEGHSQRFHSRGSRISHQQRQAVALRNKDAFASAAAAPSIAGVTTLALGDATAAPMNLMMPMPPTGDAPHYFGPYANWAYTPPLRKFVDTLPGLGSQGVNNLGQYIPVAVADSVTYPESDYYEIAVVQYREQMHSDLPPTLLRGYVQLETAANAGVSKHVALENALKDGTSVPIMLNGNPVYAVDRPHYLGPLISATRNKPVRILFRNLLPTGQGGDLFIPVDTTVMGAGMGPDMGGMSEMDPQHPMCGRTPKPAGCYTENRATLHLHGGITPWISDGTPHQWVTPVGENTRYPEGVSVQNVPDMPDPGPGAMTFFYSNQQSARLMFYHDHSWGITRLNVYAGEAAPYVITDAAEQALINSGVLPSDQIPLVVQDKTFVPDAMQLSMQDPTWDSSRWGAMGDLWVPHVYMPAQNPGDSTGVNQFGRWAYGPWFWPPTSSVLYPPVSNPHFDPNCDPDLTWCEPPLMPATPYVSMGMEAFNDTPVVNGTAYPSLTVEPKAYRLRILNAANDRFFNLQLYVADSSGTEVALNASEVEAALSDPAGVFPTPDLNVSPAGPDWIQFGTEGGFLPAPVVIPPQHITWVTDPTVFNAGNVQDHSLLLGPAERADVVVDFSKLAGKTLIMYNDAPAAFPARDPRYDYYTGNADLTDTGGAPSTIPGYGPNTRTVMQIKVSGSAPAASFDLNALQTAFAHKADGTGVFESSQNPIIVGQAAYNSAYGTSFKSNGPSAGLVQIFDTQLSFNTLTNQSAPYSGSAQQLTIPLERKAIQDEMGEAFEQEYGRMSGNLGVEASNTQAGQQQNLILYPYINPATEVLKGVELPSGSLDVTPISTTDDGTQIWKITHNGVDTHPIHFHLFDVQLINRVGWDGIIRRPDLNELGWKDTIRVSPLEDTIVAVRPIIPKAPFGLPDSIRPLNPMMPLGNTSMFNSTGLDGAPIPQIVNDIVNFGWEYVWHCHILSHEEMDMMRPISLNVPRELPVAPAASGFRNGPQADLSWTDGTPAGDPFTLGNAANEIGFTVERAPIVNDKVGAYTTIGTALANATSYSDTTAEATARYSYRVVAFNAAGGAASQPFVVNPGVAVPPAAPSAVTAVAGDAQATVSFKAPTWTGGAAITSYSVTSSPGGRTATAASGPITVTGLSNGTAYTFTVTATNSAGTSLPSSASNSVTPRGMPGAPIIGKAVAGNAQASVSFVAPVSDGGSAITAYTVTSNPGNVSATGTAGPLVVTGLTNGTVYTFTVTATNAVGTGSPSTASNAVTPATAPAAPVIGTALAGNGQATVSFATPADNGGSSVTSYTVTSNPAGLRASAASGPITVTGLTNGTAYTFTVTATNLAGTSVPSSPSNVIPT